MPEERYDGQTEEIKLDLNNPFDVAIYRIYKTADKKRKDYASGRDPFDNFKFTAGYFGFHEYQSADFNELQKLARLRNLNLPGVEPANESVEDSYLDKAVFATLAFAMYIAAMKGDQPSTSH